MNVLVNYDNQVTLAYSLNAFNAWEGYHIVFNGTKGRLEHTIVEQVYVNAGSSDAAQGAIADGGITTRIIPLRGAPRKIDPWTGTGGHGGGDKVMLDEIFLPDAPPTSTCAPPTSTPAPTRSSSASPPTSASSPASP